MTAKLRPPYGVKTREYKVVDILPRETPGFFDLVIAGDDGSVKKHIMHESGMLASLGRNWQKKWAAEKEKR